MNRVRKELVISSKLERSKLVVVAHTGELGAAEVSHLRSKLGAVGASMSVVKNSLARQAAERASMPLLSNLFRGPSAIICSGAEGVEAQAAKVALKFAKDHPDFLILGGKLGQQQLVHTHVHKLVSLERDKVYGEMIGAMHPATYAGRLVSMVDPSSHYQSPPVAAQLVHALQAWIRQSQA